MQCTRLQTRGTIDLEAYTLSHIISLDLWGSEDLTVCGVSNQVSKLAAVSCRAVRGHETQSCTFLRGNTGAHTSQHAGEKEEGEDGRRS